MEDNIRTCPYCRRWLDKNDQGVVYAGRRYYHSECWPKKLAKDEAKTGGDAGKASNGRIVRGNNSL